MLLQKVFISCNQMNKQGLISKTDFDLLLDT